MTEPRSSILKGGRAAAQLSHNLGLKKRVLEELGHADVYAIAAELDVPVMFKPLKGLLGVFMRDPTPGILVTNQRPPSVQRLTCAHELGHFFLRHADSFDDEQSIGISLRAGYSLNEFELEADGFAYELMMPRYLVIHWAQILFRYGFDVRQPRGIYQLSLRLGCSYQATAMRLSHLKLLSAAELAGALKAQVKALKRALIPGLDLASWHSDVWFLVDRDRDYPLRATVNDVLIVSAPELASAGYLNEIENIESNGFQLLTEVVSRPDHKRQEVHNNDEPQPIGGEMLWRAGIQVRKEIQTRLEVVTQRPWEAEGTSKTLLSLSLMVDPREGFGLTPETRRRERERVVALG